jgi:hypothetical protein
MVELGDLDRAPALGGSDERTEHQLQDGSLAERIRDDLETAAFLDKQALQRVARIERKRNAGTKSNSAKPRVSLRSTRAELFAKFGDGMRG